jgi:hypothetical protein
VEILAFQNSAKSFSRRIMDASGFQRGALVSVLALLL